MGRRQALEMWSRWLLGSVFMAVTTNNTERSCDLSAKSRRHPIPTSRLPHLGRLDAYYNPWQDSSHPLPRSSITANDGDEQCKQLCTYVRNIDTEMQVCDNQSRFWCNNLLHGQIHQFASNGLQPLLRGKVSIDQPQRPFPSLGAGRGRWWQSRSKIEHRENELWRLVR
jgi:hypothetical protein